MHKKFHFFVPLSNWLRGFDRYNIIWSKRLISESKWKGVSFVFIDNEESPIGFSKVQGLISKLEIPGDRVVRLSGSIPEESIRRNDVTGTGIGWVVDSEDLHIEHAAWASSPVLFSIAPFEEITASAFSLLGVAGLHSWEECRPRSFSVLPIAKACQGKCAFCFSKASVSTLKRIQESEDDYLKDVMEWSAFAAARGAERGVITGGGEPFLKGFDLIGKTVGILSANLGKVTLITNAYQLSKLPKEELFSTMEKLKSNGLTCLAISRHGVCAASDENIMGLPVKNGVVAETARSLGIDARAVCVLQKGGVDSHDKVLDYISRAARDGFNQICFKELYVSSVSENGWARSPENVFCDSHKVPLSLVIDAMKDVRFEKVAELPWESPVFSGEVEGKTIQVAAYTEPSPGWERSHGLVRSWNLLADGKCFASLEDEASLLTKEGVV